ncbi:MAG TPA: sulfatase-like hydrolase/transferase [Gemmataceae bacterium]|nr:sulfatase-like hydrolase/transferase [Gemmataceae bacterium]
MSRLKTGRSPAARAWVFCLALGLASNGYAQDDRPPNIVLFLADDLGNGDLGCYGNRVIQTPHLDAFAKQGVRLTHCYSASAVCSPSRSALLTGRTPHRNGVYTWIAAGSEVHLRTSEITLPKLLKEKGYATCHSGKWHLNGRFNKDDQPQPNDHGYDHWMATQNNAAPSHKDPTNFVRNGTPVGKLAGYSAPLVVDEAVRWLTGHDKTKPFFLTVWTHEPHLPIESDPEFQKLYADIAEPDVRQHHGNVTQLDHAFGRLMKALDDQKLTDTTFVFFTSDNGPEGPEVLKGRNRGSTGGLRGRKRAMYEGGIRVPGIARYPGQIKPGTTSDVPVIGSDFFPTALALAGAKPPADRVLDGIDVFPALTGGTVERKVPLFWRLDMAPNNMTMALRQGDWKVVGSRDGSKVELYNLKADPAEATDLSAREPAVFERLKKELVAMNAAVEKEGPDWWKRLSPDGARPPGAKKK